MTVRQGVRYVQSDGSLTIEGVLALGSSDGYATAAQGVLADTALQPGDAIPWTDITGAPAGFSGDWADLTGVPATFPPSAHTHPTSAITDFAEAVDDRVSTLLVAGPNVTLTYDDLLNTLTVEAAGSVILSGQAVVTVPNGQLAHVETVTATGVTGGSRIFLSVAPHADSDENDAELLDVAAMSAAPGAGQITVDMAFSTPTAGPIKLNWMAA